MKHLTLCGDVFVVNPLHRQHRLTHLPFWEWCPECVAGLVNDHPHRARPAVPDVHWDYCFPPYTDGAHKADVFVGRDKETRLTVTQVVQTWSGWRDKLLEIIFALGYMETSS